MNRYAWNRSLTEHTERCMERERDYLATMAPINDAFARHITRLPVRYRVEADGRVTLDESYPPERATIMAQWKEIAEHIARSLGYEPLPME